MSVCRNCEGAMAHNKERLCYSCEIEIHGTECQNRGCSNHVHPDHDEDLICPDCWVEIKQEEDDELGPVCHRCQEERTGDPGGTSRDVDLACLQKIVPGERDRRQGR